MNVPKTPGHTCPMIDKLKARIETTFDMTNVTYSDDMDVLKEILRNIRHELRGEADALEEIRDANSALRKCAEYWQERAEIAAE